jgi:hypothetical protein
MRLESQKVLAISTTDGSHPKTGSSHRCRIRIRRIRIRNGRRNGTCRIHSVRRSARRSVRNHRSARSHTW